MRPQVDPNLIAGWIALAGSESGTPEHDQHFWAFGRVWELCRDEPEAAWQFILAVLETDRSDRIVQNLSAGPLEDLLAKHPQQAIGWVELEAKTNPHFASLLGGVWQNAMPDDVWARVQAVWDRRGWDGIPAA